MPSSTSSSDLLRAVPASPWRRIAVLAAVVCLAGLAFWEAYWRSEWFEPSYRNSDGLWAITRDRIDDEGGAGTVVVGSSRVLFDLHLEAWRDETGILPIQLALEGTGPRPFLKHVARETGFAGLVVVGVTEGLFFRPQAGLRGELLESYRAEGPSERIGQRISMLALEPFLAFYDPDTALFTALLRQPFWPARPGMDPPLPEVRKLSNMRRTRQADMWEKVALDPAYQKVARDTWLAFLNAPRPPPPPPEEAKKMFDALLDDVAGDVEAIRARGGEVVFVRAPSSGPFREVEGKAFPRERFWDPLLARTGAVGIHFEDHAALQDVELPEWSHIRARDTDRFTRVLIAHLRTALAERGTPRKELTP